jgi:hypothetical protein
VPVFWSALFSPLYLGALKCVVHSRARDTDSYWYTSLPDIWEQFNVVRFSTFVHLRFEVFTAVTMKNAIFLEVTPCNSCKNSHFSGTYRLLHQGEKKQRTGISVSSN